jgi:hypothetical protein
MNPELNAQFSKRFADLYANGREIRYPAGEGWHKWSTQVTHLLEQTFGKESPHHRKFVEIQDYCSEDSRLETALGVFLAAKSDFEAGHLSSLTAAITAEVLGDFLELSKSALADGKKDVAAVLACAALEDALKRFARENGLNVDDKVMQEVVGSLKSRGLVGGAQKTLLDAMPKIRDYAMHANWEKIRAEDVRSIIGFAEGFMQQRFR